MREEKPGSRTGGKWLWIPASLLLIVGLVLVGAILGQGGAARDAAGGGAGEQPAPDDGTAGKEVDEPAAGAPGQAKLTSSLNELLAAYQQEGAPAAEAYAATHGILVADGQVQVEIVTVEAEVATLQAAIEDAGGAYLGHYEGRMEARVPIEALAPLAERPEVEAIREPQAAIPMTSD